MYQTQPDSPLPRSGTIWVDVTLTYQTFAGPPSGVQRTLLSLARLGDRNAGLNLRLAAYDPKTKIWRALDTPAFLRVFQQKMPKTRPIHQHKLIELIWWRLLLLMARYRRHNPYHLLDPTHQRSRQRRLADSPRLECQPGDVLLLADSGWVMPRHLDAVRAFDSQARIAGLVYDLIPLERPDIVPQPVAEQCLHWFRGLAQTAHQLFCISEFTRRQTKTWLAGDPEIADAIRKLRVVRLGNELADVDQPPLNTLTTLAELARGHAGGQSLPTQAGSATRWYLWLGSLDLRKNLDVVLLALERFYEQHPAADPFVIAGGQGFGYELYERKITGNPLLRQKVALVVGPDDATVMALYRGAKLFVFSSWYEGYGLPVAEALQRGVPVLASSATSIPEVGGSCAEYFEPWNSAQLLGLLVNAETDPNFLQLLRRRAGEFQPTSWQDMIQDLRQDVVQPNLLSERWARWNDLFCCENQESFLEFK